MNLLADLYSTIDSKKRQLKGLLSDPVETIRQGLLNFRDDQNKLLNDFGVGYQTPGYKSVLATPEQVKAARQSVADWGANQGIGAATVWHGSPHKFNKFDSSKIGTGEGAQAYGHGLYLAESPGVANFYRNFGTTDIVKQLNDPSIRYHNASVISSYMGHGGDVSKLPAAKANAYYALEDSDVFNAAMAANIIRNKRNQNISQIDDPFLSSFDIGGIASSEEIRKTAREAVKEIRAFRNKENGLFSGHMYKVDLPDEAIAKMLDWDKPLSQQAPKVNSALQLVERNRLKDIAKQKINARAALVQNGGDTGPLDRQIELLIEEINSKDIPFGGTGESYYKSLRNKFGTQEQAANYLKEMGIQGIRYLDGGSRGAGQGTSNYVIFPGNESLLTILERNGKPLGLLD